MGQGAPGAPCLRVEARKAGKRKRKADGGGVANGGKRERNTSAGNANAQRMAALTHGLLEGTKEATKNAGGAKEWKKKSDQERALAMLVEYHKSDGFQIAAAMEE